MATFNLAPIPFWEFLDQSGRPISNGKMFTFRALNQSEFKPVFSDPAGTIPYLQPILFDGGGTAGPFYWEDDENYYLEIFTEFGAQPLRTIDNYNAPAGGGGPPITVNIETNNFLLNGQFRYNFNDDIPETLPTDELTIAEGLWFFKKNNQSSDDSLTFNKFTLGEDVPPGNPIYFLRYQSGTQGSSETEKDIIFKFKDVRSFEGEQVTIQLAARSITSATIEINIVQKFGTGGSPSAPITTPVATFNLTPTFLEFPVTTIVPAVGGQTLGTNNDDTIELHIRMPLDEIATVDLTNNQWERGNQASPYSYESEAEVGIRTKGELLPHQTKDDDFSVIEARPNFSQVWAAVPFVGALAPSATLTVPPGWLATDGASFNAIKVGATDAPFPRLFTALGSRYGQGSGAFKVTVQGDRLLVFNNGGGSSSSPTDSGTGFTFTEVHSGATPFTFYSVERISQNAAPITIARTLMRAVFYNTQSTGFIVFGGGYTGTSNRANSIMQTVVISLAPTGTATSASTRLIVTRFSTTDVVTSGAAAGIYLWGTKDGAGTDPGAGPLPSPVTGIQINFKSTYTQAEMNDVTEHAMGRKSIFEIVTLPASSLSPGDFFTIHSPTLSVLVWYSIDGIGTAPVGGPNDPVIKVSVLGGDTAPQVATKTAAVMNVIQFQVPNLFGFILQAPDEVGTLNRIDPRLLERILPPGANMADAQNQSLLGGSTQLDYTANEFGGTYTDTQPGIPFVPLGGQFDLTRGAGNRDTVANGLSIVPKTIQFPYLIKH